MARRLSHGRLPGPAQGGRLWWSVTVVVGAMGLCVGVLVLTLSDLAASAMLGAGVGVVVAITSGPSLGLRKVMAGLGWGQLAGAALAGLVVLSGWLAFCALLLLTLTQPTVLSRLRVRLRRVQETSTVTAPAPQPQPRVEVGEPVEVTGAPPSQLSDQELCLAWRRSYFHLLQAPGPTARLRIAGRRQGILDELERRHPRAFRDWLDSGARAAGNPQPYLVRREDLPPAA